MLALYIGLVISTFKNRLLNNEYVALGAAPSEGEGDDAGDSQVPFQTVKRVNDAIKTRAFPGHFSRQK